MCVCFPRNGYFSKENVTKHFSHYKICQDQPVMASFDFIPSRQNLNKIKLLSLNVGHDLS